MWQKSGTIAQNRVPVALRACAATTARQEPGAALHALPCFSLHTPWDSPMVLPHSATTSVNLNILLVGKNRKKKKKKKCTQAHTQNRSSLLSQGTVQTVPCSITTQQEVFCFGS